MIIVELKRTIELYNSTVTCVVTKQEKFVDELDRMSSNEKSCDVSDK